MRLALAVALSLLADLAGAAGQLDPAFVNGAVPAAGGIRNPILTVARDGRILLAGTMLSGSVQTFYEARVAMFDDAGVPIPGFEPGDLGEPNAKSLQTATFDAAGRSLVGGTAYSQVAAGSWLQRIRSDGIPSSTFSPLRPAEGASTSALRSVWAIALDASGLIATGGSTAVEGVGIDPPGEAYERPVVTLRASDGKADPNFGASGEVVFSALDGSRVRGLGFDRAGIVVALGNGNVLLQRLDVRGAIDPTFGTTGATTIAAAASVAFDREGRVLVLVDAGEAATLTRYVDGRPDATFAAGGAVSLPAPYKVVATGPDGAAYAGRVVSENGGATVRVVRVGPDGSVDATYGTSGEAIASFVFSPNGSAGEFALAVDDADRVVAAVVNYVPSCVGFFCSNDAVPMLYRFSGGSSPPTTALAVEYFHAGFGHYFTSVDADEIAALDAGVFPGWSRTGASFAVLARSVGAASPACRFFSGSTFAPKSSHFYTPYPGECDNVDASPAWAFEKIAYLLRVPVGVGDGNGTCPQGQRPLYRAFNAMQGGAPNHRYTTSAATLDAMIAQGWVLEGEANTRIFACVPP